MASKGKEFNKYVEDKQDPQSAHLGDNREMGYIESLGWKGGGHLGTKYVVPDMEVVKPIVDPGS